MNRRAGHRRVALLLGLFIALFGGVLAACRILRVEVVPPRNALTHAPTTRAPAYGGGEAGGGSRSEAREGDATPAMRSGSHMLRLDGFVIDASGNPAPSCLVEAWEADSGALLASSTTASHGAFAVAWVQVRAPIRFRVRARDPATGDLSVVWEFERLEDVPDQAILLRLCSTVLISGRVVDAADLPTCGRTVRIVIDGLEKVEPWHESEGLPEETDAVSDAAGVFEVTTRRGRGTGRAFVRGTDGTWSAPVEFRLPPEGGVRLGDLIDPTGRSADWIFRFVDPAGVPCTPVFVRLDRDDKWCALSHASFDPRMYAMRADAGGVLRLRLGLRDTPALIGVGGPLHQTRALSLDCRNPGPRDVVVQLDARLRALIRLVGGSAADLVRMDVEMNVWTGRSALFEVSFETRDALSGFLVPVALERRISPAHGLEHALVGKENSIAHRGPGLFEVRVPEAGRFPVTLTLGQDESSLCERVVEFRSGTEPTEVDYEVPDGRRVVLDLAEVSGAMRSQSSVPWFAEYAAWAHVPRIVLTPSGDWVDASAAEPETPPVGLLDGGRERREVALWLPAAADSIAFGYREPAGIRSVAPQAEVRYWALPASDSERVRVPPAPCRGARLAVSVRRGGEPVRVRGVPITILRIRSSGGPPALPSSKGIRTNAGGEAEVWLLPGQYRVGIDSSVARRTPATVNVTAADMTIPLELEFEFPG